MEAFRPKIKTNLYIAAELALNTTYSNELTDSASSDTSSELKEALCNSAEEKLDQEVNLRVAAKRIKINE